MTTAATKEDATRTKRVTADEFNKMVDQRVDERVEEALEGADEKIAKNIQAFFKTGDGGGTDLIKALAKEIMDGDAADHVIDAAMRQKHAMDQGRPGDAALNQAKGVDASAASKFAGMRVTKEAAGLPVFKGSGAHTQQDVALGNGDFAARTILYAMQAKESGARINEIWPEAKKKAEEAGDKIVSDRIEKNLQAGDFSEGGALLPEAVGDIIGMLHGMTALRSTPGASPVSLSFTGAGSDTIILPRLSSGVTAHWRNEGGSVNASTPGTDQIRLIEKELVARVIQSNKFLRYAPGGADQMIKDDMRKKTKEAEEQALFRSQGTENKPVGLKYLMDAPNRDLDRTQAGDTSTLQEILGDFMRLQQAVYGNDVTRLRPAYFLAMVTWLGLQVLVDNNDRMSVLAQMIANGNILGVPFGVTSQLPDDLDVDSSGDADHTETYFVEMSEYIIADGINARIREFDQATLLDANGNPYRLAEKDSTAIEIVTTVDAGLKHGKAASNLKNNDWAADILGA